MKKEASFVWLYYTVLKEVPTEKGVDNKRKFKDFLPKANPPPAEKV